jgi:hypothetical protein
MTEVSGDIEKSMLGLLLDITDLSEKVQKFDIKDISSMIASALSSNRKHVILKKMLDLEGKIASLRTGLTKGAIQMALQKPVEEMTTDSKQEEPVEKKSPARKKEETGTESATEKKKSRKKKEESETPTEELPKVETPKVEPSKVEPLKVELLKEDPPKAESPKKEPPKEEPAKKKPASKRAAIDVPQPGGSEEEESSDNQPIHVRRKKIPKQIKTLVWNEYIGAEFPQGRCACCQKEKIDQRNYHCGHVIAESKGGDLNIKNLRPICAACNGSMGTQSMNEFTKTFFGREI